MDNIPETISTPDDLRPLNAHAVVVAGKWHEPESPCTHAAFRLSYIMIAERYAPSGAYNALCTVFRDTGLLTDDQCRHVINVSYRFAGVPVAGAG